MSEPQKSQPQKPQPQQPPKTIKDIEAQIAELEKQKADLEAAEQKKEMRVSALRATALLSAMRACMKEIESLFPESFSGEKWQSLPAQAWPRDASFKRAADLSETEVHNARDAGRAAVEKITGK